MTTATSAPSRRRGPHVALWVLQVALAVFFTLAALPKLLGDPTVVRMFAVIGFGDWFRYLTGALELLGAVGLLIPRLAALAALGLAGVMAGATITQVFAFNAPAMAVVPLVLLAVFLGVAWARRPRPSIDLPGEG
ncbi:hypothetical protein GCM10011581_22630 [Saccharopolyspora subtropica]|uniref:DoxX family protein n=1 Tax=Saccharopolyspora thermophila TaxID=89367 RepID=A0A917NB77_9PSEU|nr:DoxX family protein [Saccharopolyspora subtropica]GGI85030.1 hypothetical protein GCM10011581_22630 [Saccharopolyspora subtropica]